MGNNLYDASNSNTLVITNVGYLQGQQMKKLYSSRKIEVHKSSIHGYGVFVTEPILNAELIEECYVIGSIPYKIKKDVYNFSDYQLEWNNDMAVIALGYGAIYNHSIEPNCYWEPDYEENIIRFIAIKDIDIGEEILYNYGRVLKDVSYIKTTKII